MAMAPVCVVPICPTPWKRVLVYTDATGAGSMSWVAKSGPDATYSTTVATSEFDRFLLRRHNQVVAYELGALLSAIHVHAKSETHLVVYCDNVAALNIAVRGYSRSSDLRSKVESPRR